MTAKADFTPEEWQVVLEGPPSAGMIVVTAQRGGTFRETIAMAKAYAEARKHHGESELLDEIVSAKPQIDHTRYHSPEELKDVITRELSEFVTAPNVTVIVALMNSRFVSVIGEVAQDTRVPLTRDLRVLEAIAQAGGFGPFANKSDVRILRRNADGTESEYRFDYGAYIRGRAPGTNIVLQHGDTIIVPD